MDDLPNRSSRTRLAGVPAPSITAAEVTDEALSSIETCIKSFGSRTRNTRVSTICWPSRLNEYCTVEKKDCPAKSCRIRTKSALAASAATGALAPAAAKGFSLGSSTDRPRSTSKSIPKAGFAGIRDSAVAISCRSSADGAQTFSTFTLTCGFAAAPASCAAHHDAADMTAPTMRIFWNTAKLYQQPRTYNADMANLTLVYGLRLLPSEECAEVEAATLKLTNGREAHVTMHLLEGSKEQIEKQLKSSLDAFFDFYPEI